MRKFLTLSLLLMLSVSAFARQHSVKGTVTIGYGSVKKQDLTTPAVNEAGKIFGATYRLTIDLSKAQSEGMEIVRFDKL